MNEKTRIMRALESLAREHKNHAAFMEQWRQDSGIRPIMPEERVHIFAGLKDSGVPLLKTHVKGEEYPTEYSIVIDGVEIFQMSDEIWEEPK